MAGGWTRGKILENVLSDVQHIIKKKEEISLSIKDSLSESLDKINALFAEIKESSSKPLLPKTPKAVKKKNLKRIETIPEDDLVEIDNYTVKKLVEKQSEILDDAPSGIRRKSKREASKKAVDVIKQQQSTTLNSKMRRPSENNDSTRYSKASSRDSQAKRTRSLSSSDEEISIQPKKQMRNEPRPSTILTRNKIDELISSSNEEEIIQVPQKKLSTIKRKINSTNSRASKKKRSTLSDEPELKKANIIDETIDGSCPDDTIEASMYEDAIAKAVPIMNSTMRKSLIVNQTHIISKKSSLNSHTPTTLQIGNETQTFNNTLKHPTMNLTVVLDNFKKVVNDTMTITENRTSNGSLQEETIVLTMKNKKNSSPFTIPTSIPRVALTKMKSINEQNSLITDDESSPERKLPKEKKIKKNNIEDKPKRITRSSLMSDDEVDLTPGRKILGEINSEKNQESKKNKLTKNTLFSPYAKESVKKKIEAFEQAGLLNPTVEIESGMRLTRTKTRALAAANDNDQSTSTTSITQKLARKSLAKAKQISRAKDAKEFEDNTKENPNNSKLPTNDKLVQKQQQRTTPNSKSRLQMPSSITRGGFTTPSNTQSLSSYSKPMTGSRTNIVTNVDSFIQVKSSAQKPSSNDKLMEERKRRQQEEDARKKREEILKAQMEEKKRKREEREHKNRLAREAKEKQEAERRLQLEEEKADKEKKLLQLQEMQRIENEKKKLAYQKRVLEKEEKRKQEGEMRLQRLREQEETEKLLAEQKRREQEIEKRRLAELKAQQAETAKMRAHLAAAQAKKQAVQNKLISSYKIDSEPDSDSDDEQRPKHEIPTWAKTSNRNKHLEMQQYIPMEAIKQFFDVKKCTPDLSELFQGIDKSRLKRTSSAIWKTPPRFSMMASTD
ncbi:inner centromere protein A-like [Leptopilina boulardi]|uniref:inner centromere protein A-like n=1 Tax=Leptopilina boulardi TaxID=63433 RepID=UPI0021F5938A|nr:inner centromere protein A-like [Leptopilina boulardi]XP_051170099.1 inner centromere protein A-like [Leptopilina boulardi]XP_051170100.1 inner centromere protein A-like [Leptopilina boulardi]XP_051170101.1 inner centromere protein A-like [Leptopilina boulardi]